MFVFRLIVTEAASRLYKIIIDQNISLFCDRDLHQPLLWFKVCEVWHDVWYVAHGIYATMVGRYRKIWFILYATIDKNYCYEYLGAVSSLYVPPLTMSVTHSVLYTYEMYFLRYSPHLCLVNVCTIPRRHEHLSRYLRFFEKFTLALVLELANRRLR